jgi:hypothetical protein
VCPQWTGTPTDAPGRMDDKVVTKKHSVEFQNLNLFLKRYKYPLLTLNLFTVYNLTSVCDQRVH